MTFPGRPFRAIMSRAFHRYRKGEATQDVNDDKLDSLATAEWPTTAAEPAPGSAPETTVDSIVDPAIESVFEKSDAPTDLSQKYEETSTSSPFKQISADQIEEVDEEVDGAVSGNENDQVSSDLELLPTVDEASTDSKAEIETDQPVAESAPEQAEEQEQPTAKLAAESSTDLPATDQVESQQPVAEPVVAAPMEPPPPSVDSMISNSMGNIFQKKVTKDSNLQALLDRHPNEDMRSLSEDLRKFAEDIGASEKSE